MIFISATKEKSIAVDIHFNSFKMWKDQNENGVIDDGEMVHAGLQERTVEQLKATIKARL